jgi:hypothetical protein
MEGDERGKGGVRCGNSERCRTKVERGGRLLERFCGFSGTGLLALVNDGLGLRTEDTTTPLLTRLGSIVVEKACGLNQTVEVVLVLLADFSDDDSGGGLLVNEETETSLAFDDDIGNVHLAAQSGQPNNELNGVDIVSNHDELSLALLDESCDVVNAVLDELGLLGVISALLVGLSGSLLCKTLLLLLCALGAVVSEQFEKVGGLVLLKGLGELVDCGGDL